MRKLSKEQIKEENRLAVQISDAYQAVIDAVDEANSFREEIVEQMQEYFDNKSEKWQESEAGQAYQAWIEEWSEELEAPEELSSIDNFSDECDG